MQAKHLIIIAIIGILGLVAFNVINNSRTEQAMQASQTESAEATTPAPANNGTIGNIPKATMDKATSQINQANADTANKMAAVEKAQ